MYSNILSHTECSAIVAIKCGTDDFQISDVNIEPLSGASNGFMAVHLRAKIKITIDGRPTNVQFFIKQGQMDPEHIVSMILKETNAFVREAFVYEEIIGPRKQACWAPRFYLFKNETIVLDDVSLDGYRLPSFNIGQIDVAHCEVTLKALAAFHAHSFHVEDEKSRQLGRPYRLDGEFGELLEDAFYHNKPNFWATEWMDAAVATLMNLIDIIPENTSLPREHFKKKYNQLFTKGLRVLKPSRRYRNVVCHGDLWLKNLLFKYTDGKPEKCMLIDFQMIKYTVPANDVMMFIHLNASRDFIQLNLDHLLKVYHTQLMIELTNYGLDGDSILPWNEFVESTAEQKIACQLFPPMNKTVILLGEAFFNKITDMETYKDFVFKNRPKYILKEYADNTEFRSNITHIINDLRDDLLTINADH